MHRIPPTERIRQRLDEVLSRGLDTEEDVAGVFFRLGVERLVQVSLHAASRQLLEQEVSDYLGRERYQRREPGHTCRSVSVRAQGLSEWIRTSPHANRRRPNHGAVASGAGWASNLSFEADGFLASPCLRPAWQQRCIGTYRAVSVEAVSSWYLPRFGVPASIGKASG